MWGVMRMWHHAWEQALSFLVALGLALSLAAGIAI